IGNKQKFLFAVVLRCKTLSTCRRRRGENEQEQQEHMNRKNRSGLFFINGVGVKLAGWARVQFIQHYTDLSGGRGL
uniref:Uncharacterized protein n=1 Tax=Mastacembelus armatus TaxID=205130 RepID=A0A3Q3STP3_9TELE